MRSGVNHTDKKEYMMTNSVIKQQENKTSIAEFLNSKPATQKINDVFCGNERKRELFVTAMIANVTNNPELEKCSLPSLLVSHLVGASLDLPCSKSLGYWYVIGYKKEATFQMGYKGLIQLALRSGEIEIMNAIEVKQGELKSVNYLTEEYDLHFIEDPDEREKAKTIGFIAHMKLASGFRKTIYMTQNQINAHRTKFSHAGSNSPWTTNYEAMALKTVLLKVLKWAPMNPALQKAIETESESYSEEQNKITPKYVKNTALEVSEEDLDIVNGVENKTAKNTKKTVQIKKEEIVEEEPATQEEELDFSQATYTAEDIEF